MEVQKTGLFQTTSFQWRDTQTIRRSGFSGNFPSGIQRVKICESSSVGRRLIADGLPLTRSSISSFCALISLCIWESLSTRYLSCASSWSSLAHALCSSSAAMVRVRMRIDWLTTLCRTTTTTQAQKNVTTSPVRRVISKFTVMYHSLLPRLLASSMWKASDHYYIHITNSHGWQSSSRSGYAGDRDPRGVERAGQMGTWSSWRSTRRVSLIASLSN